MDSYLEDCQSISNLQGDQTSTWPIVNPIAGVYIPTRQISIHSRMALDHAHSFDHDTCHAIWLTTWDLTFFFCIGRKTSLRIWHMESLRHHGMKQISGEMERIMYIYIYIFIDIYIYMNAISLTLSLLSLYIYIHIWPLKIRFRTSAINGNPPGTCSDIDYNIWTPQWTAVQFLRFQLAAGMSRKSETLGLLDTDSYHWKHCCNHFPNQTEKWTFHIRPKRANQTN